MDKASGQRPLICILDGSVDVTGALVAARREAALLSDRARFMLVIPEDSRVRDADLPEFESVVRLPIRPLRKTARAALAYLPCLWTGGRRLADLLHKTECTRLQVNDYYLAQAWVARRSGFRGSIATWLRIDPRRFGAAGRIWMRAALAASDRIVAVSSFVASTLPREINATIIYDPVLDAPVLAPPGESQVFSFIGNYIEGKGQNVAIAGFHEIAEQFPQAELCFYGGTMGLAKNAAYRAKLEHFAATGAGAGRIHFMGFAEPEEALRNAIAALNCSGSESFSLTCQEASALGRAVIATKSGGPEEIVVDGETGYLIDKDDAPALADRMRRLLGDPTLAIEMGQRGARHVRDAFPARTFRSELSSIFGLN